jgi:hypothetical protein
VAQPFNLAFLDFEPSGAAHFAVLAKGAGFDVVLELELSAFFPALFALCDVSPRGQIGLALPPRDKQG